MAREYENGYPTQRYITYLGDVLGVNRHALRFNETWGTTKCIIYYKAEIANRSIETFAKFLMYSRIDVKSFQDGKIIINQSKS
jgi:hypothetical protein